mgnify:CR=1 FL=1
MKKFIILFVLVASIFSVKAQEFVDLVEEVNKLVQDGVPFRDAYKIVGGKAVFKKKQTDGQRRDELAGDHSVVDAEHWLDCTGWGGVRQLEDGNGCDVYTHCV